MNETRMFLYHLISWWVTLSCMIMPPVRATPGLKMMRPLIASSARRSSLLHAERWAPCPVSLFLCILFKEMSWNDQELSAFVWQHHCRNCGDIYCNSCSSNELALPSYPRPVRVCDMCHSLLLQRSSSTASWQSHETLNTLNYSF